MQPLNISHKGNSDNSEILSTQEQQEIEFNGHSFVPSDGKNFECKTEVSSREEIAEIMLLTDNFGSMGLDPKMIFGMLLPTERPGLTLSMSFEKHPILIKNIGNYFEVILAPNLPENNTSKKIEQILNLSKLESSNHELDKRIDLSIETNKIQIFQILSDCSEPTEFSQGTKIIFPKRKESTH